MTDICLIFEVHQPLRLNTNLDLASGTKDLSKLYLNNGFNREIFERIAERCYHPANRIMLEQIDRYRG